MKLPRQPGQKDARYAHLLSGQPELPPAEQPDAEAAPASRGSQPDRIAKLEDQVQSLTRLVDELATQFAEFKKQFE